MQQIIDKKKFLWGLILFVAGFFGFLFSRNIGLNDPQDFVSLHGYKFLIGIGFLLILFSVRVLLKEIFNGKLRKKSKKGNV